MDFFRKFLNIPEQPPSVETNELERVIWSIDDGIVVYDQDFRILFFNPAAEKLFKMSADSIIGKSLQAREAEKPELRVLVQTLFPSLAPVMISRSPAGTWPQVVDISFTEPTLEFRVTTSPLGGAESGLRLAEGSLRPAESGQAKFLKVIRDRTRETAILKSKEEFLTIASHQLKTPITQISWALEALNGDKELSEANKEIVKGAFSASRILLKIVEDFLNISKIEEGKFGYRFEPADITVFLNQILSQSLSQASRAGVRLYFDPPQAQLPMVNIDAPKLSLAVVNLLENAIRYNMKDGEVIVKVEPVADKPFLKVSVKDTGIGVASEALEKLFTKFFRAENAVKFQTEGTGLGLYIAKNIVQAHGGEIWAESELNRGTVIYFTLPTDPKLVPQREAPAQ
ncbi:MAG: PAS domain-containing sensor histidine kinase [Candidatus Liptonbacteria bacterium]|nr:PAS domain-containing sensor histidine kinase [Candidatus Liptonbacteria bacterium]